MPGSLILPAGMREALQVTRAWKTITFSPWKAVDPRHVFHGDKRPVGSIYPRGLWMCTITGVRSDDVPCVIQVPIDGRALNVPEKVGQFLSAAMKQLESYRDCECEGANKDGTAGRQCHFHATGQVAAQQPTAADVERVADQKQDRTH